MRCKCVLMSTFTDTHTHNYNKKVFLRERKRHTACRVASARYAALSPDRVPHPRPRGCPIQTWMGYLPTWTWNRVPSSHQDGVPHWSPGWGTPHQLDGVPLDLGCGTPHQLTPPPQPPMVNRQTFLSINITFPRTTCGFVRKASHFYLGEEYD